MKLSELNFVMTLASAHSDAAPQLIISVPHDSGMSRCDLAEVFTERDFGIRYRDRCVWPVAESIVAKLDSCCAIRGMIHRRFIDYNRLGRQQLNYPPTVDEEQPAFSDERLSAFYDEYHGKIEESIEQALAQHVHSKVLLLDMHGFSNQPPYAPPDGGYDLILGTDHRETVKYQSNTFPRIPTTDPDVSLAIWMRERGYKVFSPGTKPVLEDELDWYEAGFTTKYYSRKYSINAMQIEIARKFRQNSQEGQNLSKKLAGDLSGWLSGYC